MLLYSRAEAFARGARHALHLCWPGGARAFSIQTSSSELTPPSLFGTVQSHRSYIFLHTPEPPATFPARLSTPIWRALQLKASKWGGLVNFSWLDRRPHTLGSHAECCSATVFSALGGRLEIPAISLGNLDAVEEKVKKHIEGPLTEATAEEIHLYVCTHGARDCRCGNTGGTVVKTLRDEVKKRTKEDPNGLVNRIKIGEVGHVGGHQYAANLLVYPHGEWLGLLKPGDVSYVLSAILQSSPKPFKKSSPPLCPPHWRGRMGLSKDEQVQLFTTQHPLVPGGITPE